MSFDSLISLSGISIDELIKMRAKVTEREIDQKGIIDKVVDLNNNFSIFGCSQKQKIRICSKRTFEDVNTRLNESSQKYKTLNKRNSKIIFNEKNQNKTFHLIYENFENEETFVNELGDQFNSQNRKSVSINKSIKNTGNMTKTDEISNKALGLWNSIQENIENITSFE